MPSCPMSGLVVGADWLLLGLQEICRNLDVLHGPLCSTCTEVELLAWDRYTDQAIRRSGDQVECRIRAASVGGDLQAGAGRCPERVASGSAAVYAKVRDAWAAAAAISRPDQ